jgi:hypothetical protein
MKKDEKIAIVRILSDLIKAELRTAKKTILTKLSDYFESKILLETLYLNEEYEFLKLHKNYKETVLKMIKKEIPSDYALFYPEARALKREFVLHIGGLAFRFTFSPGIYQRYFYSLCICGN